MNILDNQTIIYFIAHASVLIRHKNTVVITDPWFYGPAFSSWYPCPPPALNLNMLTGLLNDGNLAICLSHSHPDHTDATFLKQIPPNTTIIIPRYSNTHFTHYLHDLGLTNVVEIDEEGIFYKNFHFRSFYHHQSEFDAAVSIETPDAFIFHGNDSWCLSQDNIEKIRGIKPQSKASLFMGQGGSASGYPLTYLNYSEDEREIVLQKKNESMLKSIAKLTHELGFNRALGYACFAAIEVKDKNYAAKNNFSHGDYANKVAETDLFLNLSPGDVYLPLTDTLIPILASLSVSPTSFPRNSAQNFPVVTKEMWDQNYSSLFRKFNVNLKNYITNKYKENLVSKEDVSLNFIVDFFEFNSKKINETVTLWSLEDLKSQPCREKRFVVEYSTMAQVLLKKIPFEDLYTGYLAEWSREPHSYYNRAFVELIISFGYEYLYENEVA